jgi:hypothetical protein
MDAEVTKSEVLELIKKRSILKRDVYELSKERFREFKEVLKNLITELKQEVARVDPRLEVNYKDMGEYYAQVTIAGDILLFSMHTNIFRFPENSLYLKSGYVLEDEGRAYCGTIQVYNFLADSFRFNRTEDVGYLIARIFINSENHFFVEGKQELGYLFNDFVNDVFEHKKMRDVICAILRYTLNFDLFIPNYNAVANISLGEANKLKDSVSLRTGKRLGFQFGLEGELPES